MSDERIRRTISAWGDHPRDGTPFHILNTIRFNPLADRYEGLASDEGGRVWYGISLEANEPTMWLRLVPLPYEIPSTLAFTLAYSVRPKTWRERLADRLFRRFHTMAFKMLVSNECRKAMQP